MLQLHQIAARECVLSSKAAEHRRPGAFGSSGGMLVCYCPRDESANAIVEDSVIGRNC